MILLVVLGVVVAFLFKLILNWLWFFPIVIADDQMEPALKVGEKVYVNRRVGVEDIKKGDVLLVRHPAAEGLYLIRRVAGLAGERVSLRDGTVFVNDRPLDTPAEFEIRKRRAAPPRLPARLHPRDNTPLLKVPAKRFYLLADNRRAALDSRVLGAFDAKLIVGRVIKW